MSNSENRKKRAYTPEKKKAGFEPVKNSDIQEIYDSIEEPAAPLVHEDKPSLWRLLTVLEKFKVDKMNISQDGYKEFSKSKTCDEIATVSFVGSHGGVVDMRLFCSGDGGWHQTEMGFALLVDGKVVVEKSNVFKKTLEHVGVDTVAFMKTIGANEVDALLLANALNMVVKSWSEMVVDIIEKKLATFEDREGEAGVSSEQSALGAFHSVFVQCCSYLVK